MFDEDEFGREVEGELLQVQRLLQRPQINLLNRIIAEREENNVQLLENVVHEISEEDEEDIHEIDTELSYDSYGSHEGP